MQRVVTTGLAILAMGSLAIMGLGQTFADAPPTWGLAGVTAHKLRDGEMQIGFTDVLSTNSSYVNYGLTEAIEISVRPIWALEGLFNASGKMSFLIGEDAQLAIPVQYYYWNNR